MFFFSEIRPAWIAAVGAFAVLLGSPLQTPLHARWPEQPSPAYGRRPSARLKFAHIAEQVS